MSWLNCFLDFGQNMATNSRHWPIAGFDESFGEQEKLMVPIERFFESLHAVASPWRTSPFGFSSGPLPADVRAMLPSEYLELIEQIGPGEGFIGSQYLRLFPLDKLAAANEAYSVAEYLPGHLLFGSDGCGNAFLFALDDSPVSVVRCPFIPLDDEFAEVAAAEFSAFLECLLQVPTGFAGPQAPNPQTIGKEVHEVHPIVLGGDPTDPKNKVLLEPATHAEATCFFNRMFREMRSKSGES